ncbi:MAG: putative sigma-54 modulation protein [Pseudomonadota bacterium]|nr:putative sigma-54 modulation protein [Pseudomonadota bacterium]
MKNLTVFCKDFELTEAIKNYLEDKLSSLYKYIMHKDEDQISFNARLGKVSNHHNHGKIFYVEVSVHTPEKNYGVRIEAEEIYAAIDILKDELAENITNYKEKSRDLERRQALKFKQDIRAVE